MKKNRIATLTIFLISFFTLFILHGISAFSAYSEGFRLIKVNSHYEPELSEKPGIIIPGTNIKAGSYKYIAANGNEVSRLGFLIDKKSFYFVQSSEYDLGGDSNFGVYKNYLVMDSWGYGSTSGHNRLMFLFKYDKTSVKLLDIIGQAYVGLYGLDFVSAYIKETAKFGSLGENFRLVWMDIRDIDNDGNPEIKLLISMGHHFETVFELYLSIVRDKLKLNLNPEMYRPLFEREKQMAQPKIKPDAYYIYGFLSKKLELEKIKTFLKGDKDQYERVITILKNVKKWDVAFHDIGNEKFVLIQYYLQGR